jgi:hypothetical protein
VAVQESPVRRFQIQSRNLLEVGYEPTSATLEVVFRNAPDLIYAYKNVGVIKFVRLLTADSVGRYFEKEIRSRSRRHPYSKRRI